jgi:hypothetical protein
VNTAAAEAAKAGRGGGREVCSSLFGWHLLRHLLRKYLSWGGYFCVAAENFELRQGILCAATGKHHPPEDQKEKLAELVRERRGAAVERGAGKPVLGRAAVSSSSNCERPNRPKKFYAPLSMPASAEGLPRLYEGYSAFGAAFRRSQRRS